MGAEHGRWSRGAHFGRVLEGQDLENEAWLATGHDENRCGLLKTGQTENPNQPRMQGRATDSHTSGKYIEMSPS